MRRHRSHQIVKQVVAQDHIEALVARRWREITGRVSIQGVGRNPSNGAGGINCSIPRQQQQGIEASRRKHKATVGRGLHGRYAGQDFLLTVCSQITVGAQHGLTLVGQKGGRPSRDGAPTE